MGLKISFRLCPTGKVATVYVFADAMKSEIFVQTNVMGTVNLLQRATEAWYDADNKTWDEGKKYLQASMDGAYGALGAEGFFMESIPINPLSPYSS